MFQVYSCGHLLVFMLKCSLSSSHHESDFYQSPVSPICVNFMFKLLITSVQFESIGWNIDVGKALMVEVFMAYQGRLEPIQRSVEGQAQSAQLLDNRESRLGHSHPRFLLLTNALYSASPLWRSAGSQGYRAHVKQETNTSLNSYQTRFLILSAELSWSLLHF